MACGKVVKTPQGILCANFYHFRRDNKVCKSVWYPSYYRANQYDIFHVKNPVDEEGFEWKQEKYQCQFQLARTADSLFTTMQCGLCIFLVLTGRREKGTEKDELLQIFVKRIIWESFWVIETSIM